MATQSPFVGVDGRVLWHSPPFGSEDVGGGEVEKQVFLSTRAIRRHAIVRAQLVSKRGY